ncbi:Abi family protein [Puia dinghuensis]|uniref:CAAX amino protease n=1 Tax=Puia dinghuensis TaxID=1792502 RepID=A0A8J2UGW8_9BACT|nr:Abi family protein [Puia dinghuensis]GGB15388.1 CAAX amino protease [Puia dinghuensis]
MYSKPVTTIAQQIQQLKDRGLSIQDDGSAEHFLSNISYYRLAGYWWPMQSDKINHIFKPNSKFDDVIALYNFDRELRILLFDVIERIEIGLRTRMINHLSYEHGFWWFQKTEIFSNTRQLIVTLASLEEELERSKDTFIKEHKKKHADDLRFPPCIKTLEIATFGSLSRLYGNLKPNVASKDIIASELKTVNHTYLHSWLQSISQIRNICAHHGRLWNKHLTIKPNLLPKPPAPWIGYVPPVTEHHKLYIHACCMKYLLDVVSPGHHYKVKLAHLFDKYPSIDLMALGFNTQWQLEPLWN